MPVGPSDIEGPEALLLEEDVLITGLHDGRLISTSLDGQASREVADGVLAPEDVLFDLLLHA